MNQMTDYWVYIIFDVNELIEEKGLKFVLEQIRKQGNRTTHNQMGYLLDALKRIES